MRSSPFRLALPALAGVALGLVLGGWWRPPAPAPAPRSGPDRPAVSYADAVARASPAVINIYSRKVSTEKARLRFRDPWLQRLFGDRLPERTRKRLETSLGSGVIVSTQGYALTNRHVIAGADEILAALPNGDQVSVQVVGEDPETDLAVLRLKAGPTPAVPLGDDRRLRVGDVVLAIGNPFGVGQTVTQGIVSALGRAHLGIAGYEDFIQTDAAINPGNSGGALIDARGRLIGINTAIFSRDRGAQGIGFAVPVHLAMEVMKQLLEHGRVVRGWIGISGQDVTPARVRAFALQAPTGVLVTSVRPGGPAAAADIRSGDLILGVDGQEVRGIHELVDRIAGLGAGRRVHIQVLRGKRRLEFELTTGARPTQRPD